VANSKRKCGYKPCGIYFRPESANDSRVVFCSPEHKILKLTTKPKAKAKPAKKKLKSMHQATEDCATTLQRLVRVKAAVVANAGGFIKCVTCGKVDHFNNMQGGHLIERGKNSVKLVEENVHPQCRPCNKWAMKKASVILDYRNYMVDMYGEEFVKKLEWQSKQVWKPTRSEVETIHNDYKARLDALEREL
jgi:hypothetical protein